jgi:hypothetical protein
MKLLLLVAGIIILALIEFFMAQKIFLLGTVISVFSSLFTYTIIFKIFIKRYNDKEIENKSTDFNLKSNKRKETSKNNQIENIHNTPTKQKYSNEINKMIEEGNNDLKSLKDQSQVIKNKNIKNSCSLIYNKGQTLIKFIKSNPDKANLARKIIEYYLNTANGVIIKYNNMLSLNIEEGKLEKITSDTISALELISQGIDKQFNKLVYNDIIDLESELKLLENISKVDEI